MNNILSSVVETVAAVGIAIAGSWVGLLGLEHAMQSNRSLHRCTVTNQEDVMSLLVVLRVLIFVLFLSFTDTVRHYRHHSPHHASLRAIIRFDAVMPIPTVLCRTMLVGPVQQ